MGLNINLYQPLNAGQPIEPDIPFVQKYYDACIKYPKALVHASR